MWETYTTFHTSQTGLQQQYHERRFVKYDELITILDIAEKHNVLLLIKKVKNILLMLKHSLKLMPIVMKIINGRGYECSQGQDHNSYINYRHYYRNANAP